MCSIYKRFSISNTTSDNSLIPKVALYNQGIPAGFPSPAQDYAEKDLDIYKLLVDKPEATFFARAKGDSMKNAGIFNNDILVVDRSKTPQTGDIIVACVDTEFTVKRYSKQGHRVKLLPENPKFAPIELKEGMEAYVWGVVTYVIHKPQ
jgi:DNA polymerase V